ncbi:hypothetical protein [Brachyspira hampsonii]|nr:hypothetical protein [Brachyspira hampsonii]
MCKEVDMCKEIDIGIKIKDIRTKKGILLKDLAKKMRNIIIYA